MAAIKFAKLLGGFSIINLLRSLIPFLLLPILTKYLSASEFGILSIFEASILILTPLLMFNSQALLSARFYKYSKEQVAKLNANALFLAAMLFIIAQFLFVIFSSALQGLLDSSSLFLLWIPVFVLCRMLNTYLGNIWQIRHQVKEYGLFSVGTLVLDLSLSLVLVIAVGMGYKGRLIAAHAALISFALVGLFILRREGFVQGTISKEVFFEIIRFGTPLIPHALGGVTLALASRYLLANELGSEAVGLYAVAYQVASAMLLAGTSINQVWSVSLFRLLGEVEENNQQVIRRLMILMLILLTVIFVLLLQLKDLLFLFLAYGPFNSSKQYFSWLLLSFYFQSVYFIFVNFDFYEERVGAIGITTSATALVNIVLNIMLIPGFGVLGSVYATVASMGLYLLLVIARVAIFNKSFRQVWGL